MSGQKIIYVCSPLRGDIENNIAKARDHCKAILSIGYVPVSSHVLFDKIFNDNIPHERETALACGLMLLKRCDELWSFSETISEGMKMEIEFAKSLSIPVKTVLHDGAGGVAND